MSESQFSVFNRYKYAIWAIHTLYDYDTSAKSTVFFNALGFEQSLAN